MKLTYIGTDERVFPTLAIIVKPGESVDLPEGFAHPDFQAGISQTKKASAASDSEAGE